MTIFNWTELIGHLPIYGTLAVLLEWSSGAENLRLWLSGLREGPLAILNRNDQNRADSGTWQIKKGVIKSERL